jgi:predicted MPP superfamily phosphohydrolase
MSLKIFSLSDLHLEFYEDHTEFYDRIKNKLLDADVLILAGDIGYPLHEHGVEYSNLLVKFKKKYDTVILIAGNHEYYQTEDYDRDLITETLKRIAEKNNVIFLEKSSYVINNIKFIGTTLWSDIDDKISYMLHDFKKAFKNADEYKLEFRKSYEWLKKELNRDDGYKKIIITHHLPSAKLCHPRFEGHVCSSAFYTDILEDLNLKNVKYWFAGHTHEKSTYLYQNTKIIVNPMGYPKEYRLTSVNYDVHEIDYSVDDHSLS